MDKDTYKDPHWLKSGETPPEVILKICKTGGYACGAAIALGTAVTGGLPFLVGGALSVAFSFMAGHTYDNEFLPTFDDDDDGIPPNGSSWLGKKLDIRPDVDHGPR